MSRNAADVVVMGTHGRSGFDRFFLGSVAEKTLRTSPVPVLVVPPRTPDVMPASRDPFRRVLCAVDSSQDSARALEYAASLARHAAGRLTLMHAVEPIPSATTRWLGSWVSSRRLRAGAGRIWPGTNSSGSRLMRRPPGPR